VAKKKSRFKYKPLLDDALRLNAEGDKACAYAFKMARKLADRVAEEGWHPWEFSRLLTLTFDTEAHKDIQIRAMGLDPVKPPPRPTKKNPLTLRFNRMKKRWKVKKP
jgi:hypothetical protein